MSQTHEHGGTAHRKLICCLLAIEIAEHDTKPVLDQIRLTQEFQQLLSDSTAHATSNDLIAIVREDGALLSFIADPKECFRTALTIREATLTQNRYRDLRLRIGLNLGLVEIAVDESGHAYLSGEGRLDVDRVMRQGPPGQISIARSFFELLSRTAPELAGSLQYQGVFSDTVGPALCLYRLDAPFNAGSENVSNLTPTTPLSSPVAGSPMSPNLEAKSRYAESAAGRRGRFRSWTRHALLPLLAVGAAFALLDRFHPEPVLSPSSAELASAVPKDAGAATVSSSPVPAEATPRFAPQAAVVADAPQTPPLATPSPSKPGGRASPAARSTKMRPSRDVKTVARVGENRGHEGKGETPTLTKIESAPPPRASGTLYLAVRPWGEVYVDGEKVGVTPPLKSFEVPSGRRVITIKNSSLPIYQRELKVEPDSRRTVAHDFGCVSAREEPCRAAFAN